MLTSTTLIVMSEASVNGAMYRVFYVMYYKMRDVLNGDPIFRSYGQPSLNRKANVVKPQND